MERKRPYWKVIVSLTFSLLGTALFVGIGLKAMIFFMPFVIGWIISAVAHPLVCFLEKRLKLSKRWGSAIIIIVVLGAIIGVLYLVISRTGRELGTLMEEFPSMYHDLERGAREIGMNFEHVFSMMPGNIRDALMELLANFDETMGEIITKISEPTMEAAGNIAKSLPTFFVGTIVTVLSAYFFTAQKKEVLAWSKKVAPQSIQKRMTMVIDNFKYAVGGYFKAQLKIMVVVGTMLVVGFELMHIKHAMLLAVLIAFLDFLPFFGTGTAMLPWLIYKALMGNYKMAIGLFVIYASTQIVRQLIQPKLVGDSVGLNPLLTLVFLYVGYKVGSILGLIFAVPVGMILINLYKAGAFDYILDDVKILVDGVLSLRE